MTTFSVVVYLKDRGEELVDFFDDYTKKNWNFGEEMFSSFSALFFLPPCMQQYLRMQWLSSKVTDIFLEKCIGKIFGLFEQCSDWL